MENFLRLKSEPSIHKKAIKVIAVVLIVMKFWNFLCKFLNLKHRYRRLLGGRNVAGRITL